MWYDIAMWTAFPAIASIQYDMSAGRMILLNLDKDTPPDFSFRVDPDSYFTPAQVRRDGLR